MSGTFETRIQDPMAYPTFRLERNLANIRAAITEAETETFDHEAAEFFRKRLNLVTAEIARRNGPAQDGRVAARMGSDPVVQGIVKKLYGEDS